MKIGFYQLPTQLTIGAPSWRKAAADLDRSQADLVLLNEMPFGRWLPAAPAYNEIEAREAVAIHEEALSALGALQTPRVVSSRPIMGDAKLRNEAFALQSGGYRALHQKHFLPASAGFYEEAWFERPATDFSVHDLGGLKVGVMLCTEIMFTEWARHYGKAGAQVILAPRASGVVTEHWQIALAMAALSSGCYVISANRVGSEASQTFGGRGFAYAPGGELIAETNEHCPLATIDVDLDRVTAAQADYPCTVRELAAF